MVIERYFFRLRYKNNNINDYYHMELRNLSEKSKLVYLRSIYQLQQKKTPSFTVPSIFLLHFSLLPLIRKYS